jgi:ABC-type multidrug transport system permease subunit
MKCVSSARGDFRRKWSKKSAWIASISRNAAVVILFSIVAFAVDGQNVIFIIYLFFRSFLSIYFSQVHAMAMHIK